MMRQRRQQPSPIARVMMGRGGPKRLGIAAVVLRLLLVVVVAASFDSLVAPRLLSCHALAMSSSSSSSGDSTTSKPLPHQQKGGAILVVGASGGTGMRALHGLLDVGYAPQQLFVLTRNRARPAMVALSNMGFGVVEADLDDPSSLQQLLSPLLLSPITTTTTTAPSAEDDGSCGTAPLAVVGCYIHSTSSDTKKLDTKEVDRARNLAAAIANSSTASASSSSSIRHVVYNSAAGEEGHGVYRIAQKHAVEAVFQDYCDNNNNNNNNFSFTSLRANLFMEELWKGYTRPAILKKGKFPFAVPAHRQIYLTSVRDMGRLAGTILLQSASASTRTTTKSDAPTTTTTGTSSIINVASDVLTPREIADAFGQAQKSPCVHVRSRFFALLARLFIRDLFEVMRFYRRSTEVTDIDALSARFPGLLTSFPAFLEETHWGNAELSYDDLKIADVDAA